MEDDGLHFALRSLQRLATTPRAWATVIAVSVLLGAAGPFGTYEEISFVPRLAYWFAVVVSTFAAGYAAASFALAVVPAALPRTIRIILAGFTAGVPVTALVLLLNAALFGGFGTPAEMLLLCANCSVVATAVVFLFALFDRDALQDEAAHVHAAPDAPASPMQDSDAAPPAATTPTVRPPLLDRLPPHQRGRLISLSVQDHYVEVRTDRGTGLVLMRLSDAIRETAGTDGLQIHRSHWVALDAVEGSTRRDGKLVLKLRGGGVLPVSRSFAAAVKGAGIP